MTAIPNDRPVLTVTEAARASGVDRRTLRRRLDGGDFPNAHRAAGNQGPESGAWLIPVEDLLRAGLSLESRTGPDVPTASPDGRSEQASLRSALAGALRRAEVAEATAAERERIIEAQEIALRAFAAAVELKDAVPVEVIALPDDSSQASAPEASAEPAEPAEPTEPVEPEASVDLSDPGGPEPAHHGEALTEPGEPGEAEPGEPRPEEPRRPAYAEATARPVPAILPGAPSRPTPPWVPVSTPPVPRRWWQRKYR